MSHMKSKKEKNQNFQEIRFGEVASLSIYN